MRKLVTLTLTAVIVVVMLTGGWACAPKPAKTLDVGIATVLTGPAAHLGTQMKNTALLAIDDQNEQGGVTIAGQTYVLNGIVRDTKKDPAVGKTVAEELVYDKKVKVIAGPFPDDAIGVQSVTEPNKVIGFFLAPYIPGLCTPDKPYTFFYSGPILQMFNTGAAYIQKFHPEAKTVVSIAADLPDAPVFLGASEAMCARYGLDWLGGEKFPFTIEDFMPVISRALAKNPDIIDTNNVGGSLGGKCALLIKQLREAGFNGIIWVPALPPPGVIEEVVPKEYLTLIVTNDIVWENPIVSDAYRDVAHRFMEKYDMIPIDVVGQMYNVLKPFFEFLDGQDTMDTTVWMEGLAKLHWQGIYGREAYWVGKPQWGINRMSLRASWASEYIDGKLETKWEAPVPYELFVEK